MRIPRQLGALGHVADAQTDAIEHFRQRQAAGADHFRKRLRISAVRRRPFRRDGARRRVEGDQHPCVRLDQRQAAGERLAFLGKRIGARGVEHDHVGLELKRRQLAHVIRQPDAFDRNVGVADDPGVHRNEIVLAGQLHAIARKINEGHGVRSGFLHLLDKIAERPSQRFAVEIARADHVEARGLQGLRDQPGIVGGGLQRAGLVAVVADDECQPLFLLLRERGKHQRGREANE